MDSGGSTATLATERSHPLGGVVDSHHHHGSCTTGEQKIDVQLTTLQSSAPTEDSLPARIMAKSREVSAQSGRKAAYSVGMDVGSTTVKAVIVDVETDQIIWSDYQRHETKQPEKTLAFLRTTAASSSPDRAVARWPTWSARSSFRKSQRCRWQSRSYIQR